MFTVILQTVSRGPWRTIYEGSHDALKRYHRELPRARALHCPGHNTKLILAGAHAQREGRCRLNKLKRCPHCGKMPTRFMFRGRPAWQHVCGKRDYTYTHFPFAHFEHVYLAKIDRLIRRKRRCRMKRQNGHNTALVPVAPQADLAGLAAEVREIKRLLHGGADHFIDLSPRRPTS